MIWKNKTKHIYEQKRKVERLFTKTLSPPTHGLAVHLRNKKFKNFKLKEFFKFTLYTGFTYLFTRKLTKTPGSKASLHCFSGDVWSRGSWNCLFARPRPDRGWIIQTMGNSGNLYSIFSCEWTKTSMDLHQSLQTGGPGASLGWFCLAWPTQCFINVMNARESSHKTPDYWLLFWKVRRPDNPGSDRSNSPFQSRTAPSDRAPMVLIARVAIRCNPKSGAFEYLAQTSPLCRFVKRKFSGVPWFTLTEWFRFHKDLEHVWSRGNVMAWKHASKFFDPLPA